MACGCHGPGFRDGAEQHGDDAGNEDVHAHGAGLMVQAVAAGSV